MKVIPPLLVLHIFIITRKYSHVRDSCLLHCNTGDTLYYASVRKLVQNSGRIVEKRGHSSSVS